MEGHNPDVARGQVDEPHDEALTGGQETFIFGTK